MMQGLTFTKLKADLDNITLDRIEIRKLSTTKIALYVSQRELFPLIDKVWHHFITASGYEGKKIDDRNLVIGGYHIILKLRKDQRRKPKPGLDNEAMFVSYINDAISDNGGPLNLRFHGDGSLWTIEDVREAKYVGNKDIFAGNKADAILFTLQNEKIPISLKKDNASSWASADKSIKPIAEKFFEYSVKSKLTKVIEIPNKKNVYQMLPVGFELDERIAKSMTFGNDILTNHGAIIVRSFQPSDFDLDDEKEILNINCSHIYRKYSDLTNEHKAYLILRNDSSRKVASNILPAGIRPEVVSGAGGKLRGVKLVTYHAA